MAELERMITEVKLQRAEFRERGWRCPDKTVRAGWQIEAAACAIRERALTDARRAILAERSA